MLLENMLLVDDAAVHDPSGVIFVAEVREPDLKVSASSALEVYILLCDRHFVLKSHSEEPRHLLCDLLIELLEVGESLLRLLEISDEEALIFALESGRASFS
jgi:hypothetical protein